MIITKIKDNVDLKELEKFGYEYDAYEGEENYTEKIDDNHLILIMLPERCITIFSYFEDEELYDIDLDDNNIDDLKEAGLVEKVEK